MFTLDTMLENVLQVATETFLVHIMQDTATPLDLPMYSSVDLLDTKTPQDLITSSSVMNQELVIQLDIQMFLLAKRQDTETQLITSQ